MIFVDLDNTLAWAQPVPEFKSSSVPTKDITVLGEAFIGAERPGAREFLTALRTLASVKLLTFTRRPYATTVSRAFCLGFDELDIVAQDDWWGGFISGPMRRSSTFGTTDVLVANTSDPSNDLKMQWIGPSGRLLVVPDFCGQEDEFSARWPQYVSEVRQLLAGRPQNFG